MSLPTRDLYALLNGGFSLSWTLFGLLKTISNPNPLLLLQTNWILYISIQVGSAWLCLTGQQKNISWMGSSTLLYTLSLVGLLYIQFTRHKKPSIVLYCFLSYILVARIGRTILIFVKNDFGFLEAHVLHFITILPAYVSLITLDLIHLYQLHSQRIQQSSLLNTLKTTKTKVALKKLIVFSSLGLFLGVFSLVNALLETIGIRFVHYIDWLYLGFGLAIVVEQQELLEAAVDYQ